MEMTLRDKRDKFTQTEEDALEGQALDFEGLFLGHWERLCRLLYRMTSDWDEAQDLALEAFGQLHRRPPARSANLGGWLYRVATNLGLNALRARKRRTRYEEEAGALTIEHHPPQDPAAILEASEERELVRSILGAMKPRPAKILILRHSGFSYAEIAGIVKVSQSSVGALLARAEHDFEKLYRGYPAAQDKHTA